MSYVIHLQISPKVEAWHTWSGETKNETEAVAFATKDQAEIHRSLCGMYRKYGWKTEVRKSKTPVNVPGPGSSFTYESTVLTKKMVAANKSTVTAPSSRKKHTKPKQLDLF